MPAERRTAAPGRIGVLDEVIGGGRLPEGFAVGDTVQLKSRGAHMTIVIIGATEVVRCLLADKEFDVPAGLLMKATVAP